MPYRAAECLRVRLGPNALRVASNLSQSARSGCEGIVICSPGLDLRAPRRGLFGYIAETLTVSDEIILVLAVTVNLTPGGCEQTRPVSILTVVLFPEPLGPRYPRIWPR